MITLWRGRGMNFNAQCACATDIEDMERISLFHVASGFYRSKIQGMHWESFA